MTSLPFHRSGFGNRNRIRASPVGSSEMRASNWTPGTALVIGVRFGALGEITARSVVGVNAPTGREGGLSGGVVAGLLVVRSALSTQLASAIWCPNSRSSRSHPLAAEADVLVASIAPRARKINQRIHPSLLGRPTAPTGRDGRCYR